jgi:hypothetical protein
LTDPSRALPMDFTVAFGLASLCRWLSSRFRLGGLWAKDSRKKLRHLAVLSDGAIGLEHDVVRTSETLPLVTIRHTVAATITIWFSALLNSFSFIGPFLQPSDSVRRELQACDQRLKARIGTDLVKRRLDLRPGHVSGPLVERLGKPVW